MGSRARIAAAACLVASGLLVGGVGTTTAFADPGAATNADPTGRIADHSAPPPRPNGAGKRSVDHGDAGDPPAATEDTGAETDAAETDAAETDAAPEDGADGGVTQEPARDVKDDVGDDVKDDVGDGKGDGVEDPVPDPPRDEEEGVHEEEKPRPPCCEVGDDDCEPGWPWPWPRPDPVDPPSSSDKDNDRPPVGVPPTIPRAPVVGGPVSPDVLDILPGVEIAESDVRTAPISVPVFVPVPVAIGPPAAPGVGPNVGPAAGAGTGGGGSVAGIPAGPRQVSTSPPPGRRPLPAAAGSSVSMPVPGSRVGYGDYLRSAGLSQIAAMALPGLAGIMILTGAGGLLGYRQAKAGQGVRSSGIARFMN